MFLLDSISSQTHVILIFTQTVGLRPTPCNFLKKVDKNFNVNRACARFTVLMIKFLPCFFQKRVGLEATSQIRMPCLFTFLRFHSYCCKPASTRR